MAQDETRAKLALQGKLRQAHDEKELLADRLEEEEENKKLHEKQIADLHQKVQGKKMLNSYSKGENVYRFFLINSIKNYWYNLLFNTEIWEKLYPWKKHCNIK